MVSVRHHAFVCVRLASKTTAIARPLTSSGNLLKSAGYRVTTAISLEEAVERTREVGDRDLLITDFQLAGSGTGKHVVSSVREIRGPDFKAIVVTGDTGSAVHGFDGDRGLC